MDERLTFLGTYARLARIYMRWAPYLLLLALIVFIPIGFVNSLTTNAELGSFEFEGIVEVLGAAVAFAALVVTAMLGEVFYTGAVAASLTHAHDGSPPSLREIVSSISYGRLIVVDLIYGLVVAIGLVLLVAPGIALFVLLALAAPVVELEDRGVRASFRRSARLVGGRFWTVLAILAPLELIDNSVTRLAGTLADGLLHDGLVAHWLADVLANLIFTPLYAVAAVLITVLLIREKDGGGPRLHSTPIWS